MRPSGPNANAADVLIDGLQRLLKIHHLGPRRRNGAAPETRRTTARTVCAATDIGWNKGKSQIVSGVHYSLNVITLVVSAWRSRYHFSVAAFTLIFRISSNLCRNRASNP